MLKDCVPQENYREECPECRRAKKHCLCPHIRPFENAFHFVILMSIAEYKYQRTGSGLLAHLTLKNSEIISGDDFTEDRRVNAIINDNSANKLILYPGKNAINFAELRQKTAKNAEKTEKTGQKCENFAFYEEKQTYIFVIDGTWRGARKIMHLSQNLKQIQCISFAGQYLSNFRIKKQPEIHCVSTIESIYYLLKEAEENGFAEKTPEKQALLDIFDKMIEIQLSYSRQHHHRREDNRKIKT